MFGFIWSNPTTTTIYLPEERVHRTYDFSQPPYYFDEVSGKRREVRPVLDLTFDMFDLRGVPIDRSPTNASFDTASCFPATAPANVIVGASGKGLVLPAGTKTARVPSRLPPQRSRPSRSRCGCGRTRAHSGVRRPDSRRRQDHPFVPNRRYSAPARSR